MAGSYRHVTNADGTFDETLDMVRYHRKDMAEAIDEMWLMILHLSGEDRQRIYVAYVKSYRVRSRRTTMAETIEEMWFMIHHLSGGGRQRIYEAYLEGYLKKRPGARPEFSTFENFWRRA